MSLHSVDCWRPFFHHCTVLEHWWRSLFQYVRMTLKAFPLVHGSICLFWCHYPTLLIAVTLQYALNSGSVKPPSLFLLSRLPWLFGVVCGFLHILREKISLSIKCHWISVRCCSESVHHFGWYGNLNNIDFGVWTVFRSNFVFCSVTKLGPTLCDPKGCSAPGFPVLHHFLEFAQIHGHWIGDAIIPVSGSYLILSAIFWSFLYTSCLPS